MPRGRKSKLRARERRQRARAEARARGAQAAAGAEGAAAGALSVSGDAPLGPPSGAAAPATGRARGPAPKSKTYPWAAAAEGAGPDLLAQKAALLVEFLLYQYKMKEPIRRGDMLRVVHKRYRKDFPDILARAQERLQLLFGLELQEAKPHGSAYLLVDAAGAARAPGGAAGGRFPRRGILMPLLSVIFLNGNCASEEEIWAFLGSMGVYDGKSDFVFGEPRQLITRDLVQERYLVYRQVPLSEPPRFEFLWGPRAQAETSKMKVLEFLARLNDTVPAAFAPHYEEALREEEERGRGPPRGPRAPKAGGGGGRQGAASCRYPHPHPE
ncbi:melanoma-associated antigen B2-like [Myotis lucifugus]|uniref:melanoma-associated antigen B2-like n=1 Tax=Myotis lucifugus TaxID=59463 RepID=UPI0006D7306D|nr:melanoma-associated antigen B2-like [Myotis lucifugus]